MYKLFSTEEISVILYQWLYSFSAKLMKKMTRLMEYIWSKRENCIHLIFSPYYSFMCYTSYYTAVVLTQQRVSALNHKYKTVMHE